MTSSLRVGMLIISLPLARFERERSVAWRAAQYLFKEGRPMSPLAWCARRAQLSVHELKEQCSLGYIIRLNVEDAIGSKCCQSIWKGFFGFVNASRSFISGGTWHEEESLWSLEKIRPIDAGSLHEGGALRAFRTIIKNGRKKYMYYNFNHECADFPNQALYEHFRMITHERLFEARARERGALRVGQFSCDQSLAASQNIHTEGLASIWVAELWRSGGNPPLSSFVNFGAQEGVTDPLWPLVHTPKNVSFALAVEANANSCQMHARNLPHVKLLCITASTNSMDHIIEQIPNSLKYRAQPPMDYMGIFKTSHPDDKVDQVPPLDFVKVDIDSTDCDVMAAFLARVSTKFIMTEVTDAVPPPFQFALHESPGMRNHGIVTPWGCSISYQANLLASFGYELVWRMPENAIFAHRTVARKLGLASPLDEVDCYRKVPLMSYWLDSRTLRWLFQELPINDAFQELHSALEEKLPFDVHWTLAVGPPGSLLAAAALRW